MRKNIKKERLIIIILFILVTLSACTLFVPPVTNTTTSYTFNKDWTLSPTSLFRTVVPTDGLIAVAHCLDASSFYTGGVKLDSSRKKTAQVYQYDHAGNLLATIDPAALVKAKGGESLSTWTEWVWEDTEKDRLYIMGWNENLERPTNELFCLKRSDNSLLWMHTMEDKAAGQYGTLIFKNIPEIWNGYLVLIDALQVDGPEETRTNIIFLDRDSQDGQPSINRTYPHFPRSLLNGNIHENELFFSTSYDSVVRLNLTKALDTSVSDADCVEFDESIGTAYIDSWSDNENVLFTDTAYIYVRKYEIVARSLTDNSQLWSYRIDTGQPSGVNSLHGDKLFVPMLYGIVYCLNVNTGGLLWKTFLTVDEQTYDISNPTQNLDSLGVVIDDQWYAIVNGTSEALFFLDIDTGAKALAYKIDGGSMAKPLNLFYQDKTLYVAGLCYVYGLTVSETKDLAYYQKLPTRLSRKFLGGMRTAFQPTGKKIALPRSPYPSKVAER
jgi:outer membrane protein assembly factor BamB